MSLEVDYEQHASGESTRKEATPTKVAQSLWLIRKELFPLWYGVTKITAEHFRPLGNNGTLGTAKHCRKKRGYKVHSQSGRLCCGLNVRSCVVSNTWHDYDSSCNDYTIIYKKNRLGYAWYWDSKSQKRGLAYSKDRKLTRQPHRLLQLKLTSVRANNSIHQVFISFSR